VHFLGLSLVMLKVIQMPNLVIEQIYEEVVTAGEEAAVAEDGDLVINILI